MKMGEGDSGRATGARGDTAHVARQPSSVPISDTAPVIGLDSFSADVAGEEVLLQTFLGRVRAGNFAEAHDLLLRIHGEPQPDDDVGL